MGGPGLRDGAVCWLVAALIEGAAGCSAGAVDSSAGTGSAAGGPELGDGAVCWLVAALMDGWAGCIGSAISGVFAWPVGGSSRARHSMATNRKTIAATPATGTYSAGLRRIHDHVGTGRYGSGNWIRLMLMFCDLSLDGGSCNDDGLAARVLLIVSSLEASGWDAASGGFV